MRELFYQNDSLGIIGEDTGFKTHTMGSTLKVGDVISFYRKVRRFEIFNSDSIDYHYDNYPRKNRFN